MNICEVSTEHKNWCPIQILIQSYRVSLAQSDYTLTFLSFFLLFPSDQTLICLILSCFGL